MNLICRLVIVGFSSDVPISAEVTGGFNPPPVFKLARALKIILEKKKKKFEKQHNDFRPEGVEVEASVHSQ